MPSTGSAKAVICTEERQSRPGDPLIARGATIPFLIEKEQLKNPGKLPGIL
jgi:hypothetical protein